MVSCFAPVSAALVLFTTEVFLVHFLMEAMRFSSSLLSLSFEALESLLSDWAMSSTFCLIAERNICLHLLLSVLFFQ